MTFNKDKFDDAINCVGCYREDVRKDIEKGDVKEAIFHLCMLIDYANYSISILQDK